MGGPWSNDLSTAPLLPWGAQAEKVEPLGGGAEPQALGALGTRAVVIEQDTGCSRGTCRVRGPEVSEGTEMNPLWIMGKCNKFSLIIFGHLLSTWKRCSKAEERYVSPAWSPKCPGGH